MSLPAPRYLPVVAPGRRSCVSCRNFDLAKGQNLMRAQPYFMAATKGASPDRLGRTIFTPKRDDESQEQWQARHAQEEERLKRESTGAQWEEFGACEKRSRICWAHENGDIDECWSAHWDVLAKIAAGLAGAIGAASAALYLLLG